MYLHHQHFLLPCCRLRHSSSLLLLLDSLPCHSTNYRNCQSWLSFTLIWGCLIFVFYHRSLDSTFCLCLSASHLKRVCLKCRRRWTREGSSAGFCGLWCILWQRLKWRCNLCLFCRWRSWAFCLWWRIPLARFVIVQWLKIWLSPVFLRAFRRCFFYHMQPKLSDSPPALILW